MNTRSQTRRRSTPRAKRPVGRPPAPDIAPRILRAAERLFSTRGFHATGMREIADEVGITPGNVYNHFETKEALFGALMADLEARYTAADQPIPKALAAMTDFPSGIEALGRAAKEQVKRFAGYIRLIYVDVIEFEGKHLTRLYGGMRGRFEALLGERFRSKRKKGEIAPDVDPLAAIQLATIAYMHYFTVEQVFGVKGHYGLPDEEAITAMARAIERGVAARGGKAKE